MARAVAPVRLHHTLKHPTQFICVQDFSPGNGHSLSMEFLIPFCRIAVSEQHTAMDDVNDEIKFMMALGLGSSTGCSMNADVCACVQLEGSMTSISALLEM